MLIIIGTYIDTITINTSGSGGIPIPSGITFDNTEYTLDTTLITFDNG